MFENSVDNVETLVTRFDKGIPLSLYTGKAMETAVGLVNKEVIKQHNIE